MDLSAFPVAAEFFLPGERHPVWHPGLACSFHTEVFGDGGDGGAVGLVLALLLDGAREGLAGRSLLWVQDTASVRLNGRPYRPGLPPLFRDKVIHVLARKPGDALFALEEGVRCRDLGCVIGEIAGNPATLDFTASRRLTLAAERHGVPLFLIRHDSKRDLSSARMRWQARSFASLPSRWNAPGPASWRSELFRARTHAPGEWILRDDGNGLRSEGLAAAPDHGDLVVSAGDRSLAAG